MNKGKKIGIIDADLLDNGTKHPNLALMKISGYYKELGNVVELIEDYDTLINSDYESIYMSKVFSFTKINEKIMGFKNLHIGGTGFFEDGGDNLPDEIEHHMPDYSLYNQYIQKAIKNGKKKSYFKDYISKSIGFATRGCFRKCKFCVNKKYDRACFHSHINEWLNEDSKTIYLWDDNILAYSDWDKVFDELEQIGKPFQFRQGLDIRLLTGDIAQKIATCKYSGDVIFAFDHIDDKGLIEKKLKLWRGYSKRGTKVYVLCGYDSIDEIDIENTLERIAIIIKYGCLPYIMRHENYKESKYRPIYVNLARWCNQPQFLKKKSFRQFCEANQFYHKNEETLCLAYSSMLNFEKEFPDISKKYFDLRFDEMEYNKKRGF